MFTVARLLGAIELRTAQQSGPAMLLESAGRCFASQACGDSGHPSPIEEPSAGRFPFLAFPGAATGPSSGRTCSSSGRDDYAPSRVVCPSWMMQHQQEELPLPEATEDHLCDPDMHTNLPPQLCAAVPKRKLSLHRRGNRRQWYHLKRKPEVSLCQFCGMVAARGTMFTGNALCTGQCVGASQKAYPEEYKQPC